MLTTPDQEAAQGINYTNVASDELGLTGFSFSAAASTTSVDLEDPQVPIDNEQLLLLNSTFDPFQYSVEECEDVYVAVRQFLKECV